ALHPGRHRGDAARRRAPHRRARAQGRRRRRDRGMGGHDTRLPGLRADPPRGPAGDREDRRVPARALRVSLFDSPWPAEDGGHRRRMIPRARGLGVRAGERLEATTRDVFVANMVVLRGPGEVYLQGSTTLGPDNAAFVERVDPATLEPLARSPDLD